MQRITSRMRPHISVGDHVSVNDYIFMVTQKVRCAPDRMSMGVIVSETGVEVAGRGRASVLQGYLAGAADDVEDQAFRVQQLCHHLKIQTLD